MAYKKSAFPFSRVLLVLVWLSLCLESARCGQRGFTDLIDVIEPDLSDDRRNRSVESDNNSSFAEDRCVKSQPSSADVGHLCQREGCDVIHCVRSAFKKPSAHGAHASHTVCISKVCNLFSTSAKKGESAEKNLLPHRANVNDLQKAIDSLAKQSPDVTKVKDYINLTCVDTHSIMFGQNLKVQVINLPEATYTKVDNSENLTKSEVKYEESINVHLFYFRFVSRWESYIKFPKWHATMQLVKERSEWNVFSNDNFQSTSLVLENNLRLLLGGEVRNRSQENLTETSLIHLAINHGRCVMFNFIGCHHPSNNDNLQALITSSQNIKNCAGSASRYYTDNALNVTSCGKDKNDFSFDPNADLRRLLNEPFTIKKSNIFSISLINVPDLHPTYDLDRELAYITSSLIPRKSLISIFMSDVGDPKYSRLDSSIFLRQQTFNPFLITMSPKDLNISFPNLDSVHVDAEEISHADISHFLKTFIVPNTEAEIRNDSSIGIDERTNSSSLVLNVLRGPLECICQGHLVHFPNDSIQSAFASFAVGSINNHFFDLSLQNQDDDVKCGRLVGVRFFNVRHVLLGNSTYITSTVLLTSEPHGKATRRILRLDTHLRYTTNKGLNFSLHISPYGNYQQGYTLHHEKATRLYQKFCGRKTLLESFTDTSSSPTYGHFGVEAKVKPLPVSCLLLMTTKFADSTVLEVSSSCEETGYDLTLSAELIDTISLVRLPATVTVRPREVRYISSLVKAYYGATSSAYKLSFKIVPTAD